uniref:Uncharacterized protein n=1 Tax=Tetradesmus obliquus TaxID=3088 RepID=A0A383WMK2_TETOB|eukprot:jgi/Sobl393_1/6379/SZX78452.1
MTAAAARNAARPLALQGSGGPKAKLRQAAQQLAAAATHAAASLPASGSRYGRLMRRALGDLNGPPAAAAAAASDSGDNHSVHGGSNAGAAAATGDGPAAAAGLAVLVLEYPRPAGTRGAASSAELRFLGKYSPCEVHLSAGTSLAGLLTHSSSLASLALHNQALHPLGLSCMALAAARSSSLTSLSLRGSAVGDQGAIELARLLASCPCLASLCLRGCGLHQEGGAALGAALPQARRLVKLDLSANRLAGPRCIVALASGLRLSGCGVSSAGGPGSSAAAAAAGLQELLLEEVDDLGEQVHGLAAVAAALGCNSQLSRLSLAGSGLSGTALAAMAAAGLAAAAALACLDLSVPEAKMQKASASQRPTGTEGGMAPAADGMRNTRSAASLAGLAGSRNVSSAGMIEQCEAAADEGDGDGGAGLVRLSLAWAAAGSQAAAACCLRELNLKGQPLPQPAAAALALAIKQLPVLQTLKLSDPFGLGEQQLGVLCLAVAAAPALQQLELQQCGSGAGSRGALGLAAARAIAQMISAPGSHLLSLDLSFSCFSEEAEEADAVWSVLAGALVCSKHARAGRRGWQRCISSKAASASLDALMASGALSPSRAQQQQQQQQQQHVCGGCRLQHLSMAHCGVPGSGVEVLAAALSSNAGLVSLDLSGVKQDVAAAAFREVLRGCSAAALAAAAATPQAGYADEAAAALSAAAAGPATAGVVLPSVCGCALRSLKVTGEDYAVVDLLSGLRQQVLQRQAALQEDAEECSKGQAQRCANADAALL